MKTNTVLPNILTGGIKIKALHQTEMRTALKPAFVAATGTAPAYTWGTDTTITGGSKIHAADINNLRDYVVY